MYYLVPDDWSNARGARSAPQTHTHTQDRQQPQEERSFAQQPFSVQQWIDKQTQIAAHKNATSHPQVPHADRKGGAATTLREEEQRQPIDEEEQRQRIDKLVQERVQEEQQARQNRSLSKIADGRYPPSIALRRVAPAPANTFTATGQVADPGALLGVQGACLNSIRSSHPKVRISLDARSRKLCITGVLRDVEPVCALMRNKFNVFMSTPSASLPQPRGGVKLSCGPFVRAAQPSPGGSLFRAASAPPRAPFLAAPEGTPEGTRSYSNVPVPKARGMGTLDLRSTRPSPWYHKQTTVGMERTSPSPGPSVAGGNGCVRADRGPAGKPWSSPYVPTSNLGKARASLSFAI